MDIADVSVVFFITQNFIKSFITKHTVDSENGNISGNSCPKEEDNNNEIR